MKNKEICILIVILIIASILRLSALSSCPPGLAQDEGCNAWNAYCLAKTGHDQFGVSWPIVYCRGLGGNYTTLFIYMLLPFLYIFGLSVQAARIAPALLGIVSVLLIYIAGKRLFNPYVGLVAAGFLAVNPWPFHLSRLAHEGCVCPFAVAAGLVILLYGNLSLDDNQKSLPSPLIAALAGLMIGIFCYGYPSIRIFWPFFLVFLVLLNWKDFLLLIKNSRGLMAFGAFTVSLLLILSPMAYTYITEASTVAKHGETQFLWKVMNLTPLQLVLAIIYRYINHFNPWYLFVQTDFNVNNLPGAKMLHFYMFPLTVTGFIVLIYQVKSSRSARLLLALILAYPVADSMCFFASPSQMRSAPGMCGIVLLAAIGSVNGFMWLWKKRPSLAYSITSAMALLFIINNLSYFYFYFYVHDNTPVAYRLYQVDVRQSCEWLKPRLNEIDAVFMTTSKMNQPYIMTLIYLNYEPSLWLKDVHLIYTPGEWDWHVRYGKMNFIYSDLWLPRLKELQNNGKKDRVVFIVRPGELDPGKPVEQICDPSGQPSLNIYDIYI
ncbi:MAG: glycosyltransferase family 39 protein [Candidatus Eremiobacterota bacterium]